MGSIPTGGALEVWPWTFGFRTALLVQKSAGLTPIYHLIVRSGQELRMHISVPTATCIQWTRARSGRAGESTIESLGIM